MSLVEEDWCTADDVSPPTRVARLRAFSLVMLPRYRQIRGELESRFILRRDVANWRGLSQAEALHVIQIARQLERDLVGLADASLQALDPEFDDGVARPPSPPPEPASSSSTGGLLQRATQELPVLLNLLRSISLGRQQLRDSVLFVEVRAAVFEASTAEADAQIGVWAELEERRQREEDEAIAAEALLGPDQVQ